ncbi:MAG TPA: PIG-L family deacetylase [Bryobacteraceae bacterium]|nr:PIG-L family deacetylase [Bryobacteraceae bacterium]
MSASDNYLIVAPHPDDECIGAAIWLFHHRETVRILHITDGSPRDMDDARGAGFSSRAAYADTRRNELYFALAVAGIAPDRCYAFDFVDKETYRHLPELVEKTTALIEELQPTLVLSPAYEGGHPDHDSTALAVAIARDRLNHAFQHREYRLYHAGPDGSMQRDDFLPDDHVTTEVDLLSAEERELKSRMLSCFLTQTHVISLFTVENELFRDAPRYNFNHPPHDGPLLYERWGWPITGEDWRRNAREIREVTVTRDSAHECGRPIFGSDISWRPQQLRNRT